MFARFWVTLTTLMVLTTPVVGAELKIASWNIRKFGPAKAGLKGGDHEKKDTLGKIAGIINGGKFDLIAIQEVQDKDFRTLPELLETLCECWDYVESGRTGPGRQKEQYAIFFNSQKLRLKLQLGLKKTMSLYDDWNVEMKRLPGYCSFEAKDGSFDFTIITFHNSTWGDGAEKEAELLDNIYDGVQKRLGAEDNDILLLGDFNVEKNYEDHFDELTGKGFKETIPFGTDTMWSGSNKSTLDNIFYLKAQDLKLKSFDVLEFDNEFGEGYDQKISDHYPVWATFEIKEDDDQEVE